MIKIYIVKLRIITKKIKQRDIANKPTVEIKYNIKNNLGNQKEVKRKFREQIGQTENE